MAHCFPAQPDRITQGHGSFFGVEDRRFARQTFKASMPAGRRVERGDEGIPVPATEREDPPIGIYRRGKR
jgi:hypothetical protein